MTDARDAQPDGRAQLEQARVQFLETFAPRVQGLREALATLEQRPQSTRRRDNLLRRAHAMGAAARVLGFELVAEALTDVERRLRAATDRVGREQLRAVACTLDELPQLATGHPADGSGRTPGGLAPASAVVFGTEAFALALATDTRPKLEIARAEDLSTARDLAMAVAPDVAVVDADLPGAAEFIKALGQGTLLGAVPVVVTATIDTPDLASRFLQMGAARVLSKPVPPDTLYRAVAELLDRLPLPHSRQPLGRLTAEQLSERIADEVRRGLVNALEPGCEPLQAELGEGTDILAAVWGAVARVRELVTVRSQGAIRFDSRGPEGAVTLAPWVGPERHAGDRQPVPARESEDVPLRGRRAVVADDDPAVVWFVAGLLAGMGMEVLEAHDGQRAFELTCTTWPDVLVSDVLMPVRDGFTLCRDIKRDVAVRDVPVILLSWKEDLLRRVRELGADADGYLKKEAPASAVVQRVREVLRPRARVESRLAAGGKVCGRLDGITPRLLLQLACARPGNATVTVRDAAFVYEVEIRDGRLRAATRTAADGSFVRGERVLAGLLGVGSGRFVVTPNDLACRSEFAGELEQVLAAPIRAARAAQHALVAEALPGVARVDFDSDAVAAYAALSPRPAQQLAQRLLDGVSPRHLLLNERVAPRLLEAVLADLARHGGVLAVHAEDGSDLLGELYASVDAAEPHSELPPEILTPSPWFTFHLSPALPGVEDAAPGPATQPGGVIDAPVEQTPTGVIDSTEQPRAELRPVEPGEPRERVSLLDGGWDAERGQAGTAERLAEGARATLPGVGKDAVAALAAAAAARASAPGTPTPVGTQLAGATAGEAPQPTPPEAHPSQPDLAPSPAAAQATAAAAQAPQPTPTPPEAHLARPDAEPAAPGALAADESAEALVVAMADTSRVSDEADAQRGADEPQEGGQAQRPRAFDEPGPPSAPSVPEVLSDAPAVRPVALPAPMAAERHAAPGEPQIPAAAADDGGLRISDELAQVAEGVFTAQPKLPLPMSASEPDQAGHEPAQPTDGADAAVFTRTLQSTYSPFAEAGEEPAAAVSLSAPAELSGQPAAEHGLTGAPVSDAPPQVAEPAKQKSMDRALVSSEPPSGAPEPQSKGVLQASAELARTDDGSSSQQQGADASAAPAPRGEADGGSLSPLESKSVAFPAGAVKPTHQAAQPGAFPEAQVGQDTEQATRAGEAEQPRLRVPSPMLGAIRTGLITVVAAAASFTLVRWWFGAFEQTAADEPAASASAEAPAPGKSAPASQRGRAAVGPSAGEAQIEVLPLPPGIALAEGKGLLEVDTGGRHAIYVGQAFVGRGPIRRIELDPGAHKVRVRTDAHEQEHTVTISRGRRTRLALARSP